MELWEDPEEYQSLPAANINSNVLFMIYFLCRIKVLKALKAFFFKNQIKICFFFLTKNFNINDISALIFLFFWIGNICTWFKIQKVQKGIQWTVSLPFTLFTYHLVLLLRDNYCYLFPFDLENALYLKKYFLIFWARTSVWRIVWANSNSLFLYWLLVQCLALL